MVTQLAIAYNNTGDQPKAITLLKSNRINAGDHDLKQLFGSINIALARVYRKLAEFPICRDFAEKALDRFRDDGNWLGMAEAYREIANSYHQEGNSERSIEMFQRGIQIIGEKTRLRSCSASSIRTCREPIGSFVAQDGIECLEKSIEFFDQTADALNSVIAYNNLGINPCSSATGTRPRR